MFQPRVLSIAGTDPTGGAGIQADIKAIAAAGGYGMSVITSLVAQNTQGVRMIHTPPMEFLTAQLEAVSDDVTIDAIKIGMLGDTDTIDTVRAWMEKNPHRLVVVDPVMIAASGDRLLAESAESALKEFLELATVVTPNILELAMLCETDPPQTMAAAIDLGQALADERDLMVIVKGGQLQTYLASNAAVFPTRTGRFPIQINAPRISTNNTHGTGCSLSSALATRLAHGEDLAPALEWTTSWLGEALRGANSLNVGKGHGPIDHFAQIRRKIRNF